MLNLKINYYLKFITVCLKYNRLLIKSTEITPYFKPKFHLLQYYLKMLFCDVLALLGPLRISIN